MTASEGHHVRQKRERGISSVEIVSSADMLRRAPVYLLLVCLSPLLVGCGGSSDSGGAAGGGPQSSATATKPKAAGGRNPVDGPAFCSFLKKMEPRLKADGSKAGAEADLAIELAGWIEKHAKPRTASDLDDATKQACPQTRTEVVKLMGGTSFADTLG